MNDRLYRSREERILAGVAGGVAERFDLDPSLVRVLWVVLVFVSGGLFLLLYIAMALVVPEAPGGPDRWAAWGHQGAPGPGAVPGWGSTGSPPGSPAASDTPPPEATTSPAGAEADSSPGAQAFAAAVPPAPGYRPRRHHRGSGGGAVIAGIILVIVGGYLLLRAVVPQVDLGAFWPLVLVGIGVALLVGSIRPGSGGSPVE